ncbi:MAG: hypothetical protein GWP03_02965 [Proteobacteria bacterium]|nr:hypothetical protein [Pseudomonadota bacterium]
MEKPNNLLFTNKYHAITYILHNLKNNYKKVILPSVIGHSENNIFSNSFTGLYYYNFKDYSPDYENIKELIDKNSLLVLRDINPCREENIPEIVNDCGLVIKENSYVFEKDDEYVKNIIRIGNLNVFYRSPLGVYVETNDNVDSKYYEKLPRTKESFSFRISSSFYSFIRNNEGVLDLIDEHIERVKSSDSPRLGKFLEKRIRKIDMKSLIANFNKTGGEVNKNIKNRHFKILYCKKFVYSALIIFVRDKTSLFSYLEDNGIKPLNYFENDLPMNERGVKFNDSLIFIGLAHFLGNDKEIKRLIDVLNRW